MADDVYVLNEGENIPTDFTATPSSGTFNIKTSVNPRVVTVNSSNSTILGTHCYEIHSDDESTMSFGSTQTNSVLNRFFPINSKSFSSVVTGTAPHIAITSTEALELTVGDIISSSRFTAGTTVTAISGGDITASATPNTVGSDTTVFIKAVTHVDNIIENPGYRITIDTESSSGLSLATTRDYFVVVYADNPKKHHVAKITEQTQYDGDNYHFEFTPRLKENISVGTKVAIYQGPEKTDTNVVAVGYGLLNDVATSEERHDKYVDVSRPTFYFYEGDKLDHDRKYTLLKSSTHFSGVKKSVFKTAPISSNMIIDKGFFTHHGDLTDNNKENDNASTPKQIRPYDTSSASTYTFDRTTWAGSSKNIYDSDGGLSLYRFSSKESNSFFPVLRQCK
jgi:hypothetical protein